jgi:hypothetical protein
MAWLRVAALLAPACLAAQSLQILPAPPQKDSGSFQIMLANPAGKSIAGLQWRVSVTGATVPKEYLNEGTAAKETHKMLACASVAGGAKATAFICMLSGGKGLIAAGPVAVVRFAAAPGAHEVTVQVTGVVGATPDGHSIDVKGAEATIALDGGPGPQ